MTGEEIKAIVQECLNNARENGFEFVGMTSEEIALDMFESVAELEGQPFADVLRAIEECRTKSG